MSESDLYRFTQEEWADKPYLIELRGGKVDGQRFRWHELPMMWRQPEPPPITETIMAVDSDLTRPTSMRIADYRRTDSVRDDGAHVYQFDRYE